MTPPVPPPVRYSSLCWIAASVVYVVGTVVASVLTFRRLATSRPYSLAAPGVEESFNRGVVVGVTVSVVAGLGLGAAVVLFAVKLRAGQQWARITLTALAGVFILFNLLRVVGIGLLEVGNDDADDETIAAVGIVSAVITLLLLLAAVILQWLPSVRAHFAPRHVPPPWAPGYPWPPPPGYPWPPGAAGPRYGSPWPPPDPAGPPGTPPGPPDVPPSGSQQV